jgi:hypothetical protein
MIDVTVFFLFQRVSTENRFRDVFDICGVKSHVADTMFLSLIIEIRVGLRTLGRARTAAGQNSSALCRVAGIGGPGVRPVTPWPLAESAGTSIRNFFCLWRWGDSEPEPRRRRVRLRNSQTGQLWRAMVLVLIQGLKKSVQFNNKQGKVSCVYLKVFVTNQDMICSYLSIRSDCRLFKARLLVTAAS